MTGALDTEMLAAASELCSELGRTITYYALAPVADVTRSNVTENPTAYSIDVGLADIQTSLGNGTTAETTAATLIFSAEGLAFTPRDGDQVDIDGTGSKLRVLSIEPIRGSAIIVWIVKVEK